MSENNSGGGGGGGFAAAIGKMGMLGCGGLIAFVVIVGGGFLLWYMSVNNTDATLRAAISAEQDNSKIAYDNAWKSIQEVAEVPDKYQEDFRNTWKEIVNGQVGQSKGMVTAFVSKYNPQFDSRLYEKLMTVIQHERKSFVNAQKKLRDKKREHDTFRTKMPVNSMLGRAIFGTFSEVEVQLVLSEKTDNAFETGRDDRIDVFGKKQKAADEKKAEEEKAAKEAKDKAVIPPADKK